MRQKRNSRNDDAFLTITNQDIYDRIGEFCSKNEESHKSIIRRLDMTNGKVKWHSKALYFIAGLLITIIGWMLSMNK